MRLPTTTLGWPKEIFILDNKNANEIKIKGKKIIAQAK
jgi:hypothetical protein